MSKRGVEMGARIEHIGSTSVPGLYVPEYEAEIPDRRYFRKPDDRPRTHHLHCLEAEGEPFRRHLTLRDRLRERPDLVDEYSALKRMLAERFGADRVGYTGAKSDFVARVLRGRTVLALTCAMLSVGASPACAQSPTAVVGVVGGHVDNRHLWKPSADDARVSGFTVGAFLTVPTGVGWLDVQAEGLWTKRGGDVDTQIEGLPYRGGIRSDYLTITLRPRASLAAGPASLFVAAGPTIDQLMRSRLDPSLAPVLEDGAQTVFGFGAGLGLGARIGDRLHAEVEARVFEGLGDAYSGDFVSVRNRSFEIVGRLGTPRRSR